MDHHALGRRFAALTTAHLADACIRAQVQVRCAPALLRAVEPGSRLAGRVCPAKHAGSVDVFLEAIETAAPGDVLVADNGGGWTKHAWVTWWPWRLRQPGWPGW